MTKTDYYDLAQAKKFFEVGAITGFEVQRAPMDSDSWVLLLKFKDGDRLMGTARGGLKTFKSMDSVIKTLSEIGFKVDSIVIK